MGFSGHGRSPGGVSSFCSLVLVPFRAVEVGIEVDWEIEIGGEVTSLTSVAGNALGELLAALG